MAIFDFRGRRGVLQAPVSGPKYLGSINAQPLPPDYIITILPAALAADASHLVELSRRRYVKIPTAIDPNRQYERYIAARREDVLQARDLFHKMEHGLPPELKLMVFEHAIHTRQGAVDGSMYPHQVDTILEGLLASLLGCFMPEGFSEDHSWSGNMNCYAQAANVILKNATVEHQIVEAPTTNYPLVFPNLPAEALHYLRHLSLTLVVTDLAMLQSTWITNLPAALRILDLCRLLKSLRLTIRFVEPHHISQPPVFDMTTRATFIAKLVTAVKGLIVPEKLIRMGSWSDNGGPWTVTERIIPSDPDTYRLDDDVSLGDSDGDERYSGDLDHEELTDEDTDCEENEAQTDDKTSTHQNEKDDRAFFIGNYSHNENLYGELVGGEEVDEEDADSQESESELEEEEMDDDNLPIAHQSVDISETFIRL